MKHNKKFSMVGFTLLMLFFWVFFIIVAVFDPIVFRNSLFRPLVPVMVFVTPLGYLIGIYAERKRIWQGKATSKDSDADEEGK